MVCQVLPTHRIAVADDDLRSRSELAALLSRAGHNVAVQAGSTAELIERCRIAQPELIIAEFQMPGLAGHATAREISAQFDLPVIALSRKIDDQLVESTCCSRIFAHLLKPVRETELFAAVSLAILHFHEFRALRKETIDLQQALDDRKIVERAKGLIMRRQAVDEPTAFRHLQQMARNHRLKMVEVAKSIILAHEALHSSEPASSPRYAGVSTPMPRRQSG